MAFLAFLTLFLLLACVLGSGTAQATTPATTRELDIENLLAGGVALATGCHDSRPLAAGEKTTLSLSAPETKLWVVPDGARLQCDIGCSECFFINLAVTPDGEVAAKLGFGVKGGAAEDNEVGEAAALEEEADGDEDILPGCPEGAELLYELRGYGMANEAGVQLSVLRCSDGTKSLRLVVAPLAIGEDTPAPPSMRGTAKHQCCRRVCTRVGGVMRCHSQCHWCR